MRIMIIRSKGVLVDLSSAAGQRMYLSSALNTLHALRAHDLHLLSCGFILVRHLNPRILLQERCQYHSHLVTIRAPWINDGRDTSDHGTVEHFELAGDGKELEVGNIALEFLPDLEIKLGCFKA
jgi:hypothetical protein